MNDESVNISLRTWKRSVDPINKVGYSDGVTDGQAATYQSSFDTGYEQGFNFGFQLGLTKARSQIATDEDELRDPRKINCQICLNNCANGNTMNLFNVQREKNKQYLTDKT
ncbi:PREDICTED: uncharacterized protein LOC106119944 [Papilio xuthus]|uniref:Uncharacterized protein LOC106119944 n=1 Tax=Papilio xuthus TaxID=66420 RepID=A0A194PG48_PAPXU|nr:PREDICTED: uncharacterized protein LOC106119944 [Papilio xuthus]KPI92272.1 hypothetical protein RR46_13493 [Papilio xuthus]